MQIQVTNVIDVKGMLEIDHYGLPYLQKILKVGVMFTYVISVLTCGSPGARFLGDQVQPMVISFSYPFQETTAQLACLERGTLEE